MEPAPIKLLFRPADGHKGSFGHALLLTGSRGMMGAALLCTKACLRSGVGLTSVFSDFGERLILQTGAPEALCLENFPDLDRYQAIGCGPGWGLSNHNEHLNLLLRAKLPVVWDADALNLLALTKRTNEIAPNSILTPHPGEMERLSGVCAIQADQQKQYARNMANRLHCVMVLKGHQTYVTDGVNEYINTTGNNGMGTGGSGDVLTGLITGLRAQGYNAYQAACLGVYLHGLAGDLAARYTGVHALTASDLINQLGSAFLTLY